MAVDTRRIPSDGPVPAGRYFAHIADNLRAQNMPTAADLTRAEAPERRLGGGYRSRHRAPTTTDSRPEHTTAPI